MNYLLDTCVLSELRRQVTDQVKNWFNTKRQNAFHISVVTIAELLDGIERLPASVKKKDLQQWFFHSVMERFKKNILPINVAVAHAWGALNAKLRQQGIAVGTQDLYLAATAQVNDLTIVTVNTRHFNYEGIQVINPWKPID